MSFIIFSTHHEGEMGWVVGAGGEKQVGWRIDFLAQSVIKTLTVIAGPLKLAPPYYAIDCQVTIDGTRPRG